MLGVFLDHIELSKMFMFIDYNDGGQIDNFEWMDFFVPSFPTYQKSQDIIDHERLKANILEYVSFQFNQKDLSLLEGFKNSDHGQKGYLDYRDFSIIL